MEREGTSIRAALAVPPRLIQDFVRSCREASTLRAVNSIGGQLDADTQTLHTLRAQEADFKVGWENLSKLDPTVLAVMAPKLAQTGQHIRACLTAAQTAARSHLDALQNAAESLEAYSDANASFGQELQENELGSMAWSKGILALVERKLAQRIRELIAQGPRAALLPFSEELALLGLQAYLSPAGQMSTRASSAPSQMPLLPSSCLPTSSGLQRSCEHKRVRSPEHSEKRAVRQRLMSPLQQSLATFQSPARIEAAGQAVLSLQQRTSQPCSQPPAVPAGGEPEGGSQQQHAQTPVGGNIVPESLPPAARDTDAAVRQQTGEAAAADNGAVTIKEVLQSVNPTGSSKGGTRTSLEDARTPSNLYQTSENVSPGGIQGVAHAAFRIMETQLDSTSPGRKQGEGRRQKCSQVSQLEGSLHLSSSNQPPSPQAACQRGSRAEPFGDSGAAAHSQGQSHGRQAQGEEEQQGFEGEAAAKADASGSIAAGALPEQLPNDKPASPEHGIEMPGARGRREHSVEDSQGQRALSGLSRMRVDSQGLLCSGSSQQDRSLGKQPHGQVLAEAPADIDTEDGKATRVRRRQHLHTQVWHLYTVQEWHARDEPGRVQDSPVGLADQRHQHQPISVKAQQGSEESPRPLSEGESPRGTESPPCGQLTRSRSYRPTASPPWRQDEGAGDPPQPAACVADSPQEEKKRSDSQEVHNRSSDGLQCTAAGVDAVLATLAEQREHEAADEGTPRSGPVTQSDELEPTLTPRIPPEICCIPMETEEDLVRKEPAEKLSGSPNLAEGSGGRLSPWNTPAFSAPGRVATSQEEGLKNIGLASCSAPNPRLLHVGLLTQRMCGSLDTPAAMPNVTPGVFHSQKQMWGRRLSGLLPHLQRRTTSDGSPFVRPTGTPANNQIPGRNHASQPTPQVCKFVEEAESNNSRVPPSQSGSHPGMKVA